MSPNFMSPKSECQEDSDVLRIPPLHFVPFNKLSKYIDYKIISFQYPEPCTAHACVYICLSSSVMRNKGTC